MISKIAYILVVVFLCREVHSSCSDIADEDKIDCVQHESWTPESCVAKGCCYKQATGFPSCYYTFGNKHEARCAISGGRSDCGNADTTEITCIKSGCCWDMKPGPPYCYHAKEIVTEPTETPSTETESPVTPDTDGTTVTDGSTDSTDNPVTSGPIDYKGRGAKVPFVEIEAEHAKHNGKVIGNDRTYGVLSSEAQGRRAVTLSAVGQYVEFTMPIKANTVVVRYSIPDTAGGKDTSVRNAPIDLYVDGKKLKSLTFTSAYSWWYGGYPFNNRPGDTNPHHFYTELRTFLDKAYDAGTKVKFQVTSTSQSPTFTIDLADFEMVGPPKPKPAGAISVLDFKADPTGKVDSHAAFQKAVDTGKAEKKVVYIPEGTYLVTDHVIVDQVTLQGAGPWYSVLTGRDPHDSNKAVGVYGKFAADTQGVGSKNVILKDFAIIGDIRERNDQAQVNAIGGSLSDSVIDNLWLQHTKCGCWMDGPMNNLKIQNSRIVDMTADGVNFHIGVTNSVVQNTFLRNLGDDGVAMWAEKNPNVNNKVIHNTIILPILANNVAIYGGKDIEVSDNLIMDTISNGGGIHIANRYPGVQGERGVKGTHKVYRNTLIRAGNSDFNWKFGVGAIWFSGLNEDVKPDLIHVKDCEIIDSSYAAIHTIEGKTFGVTFENVLINGTGTFALQFQAGGEFTFKNVKAINVQQKNPQHNCVGTAMKLTSDGTKTGWYTDKPFCGPWPAPKWPWFW